MQLNAGRLLQGGKYIINHPLETQGFGITYLGTQTEQGQSVVLKTLHPALYKSRAFGRLRDRFIHIASELTHCHHPNLMRVNEIFQEGEWPFVVAEYVHGKSLAELVQPGRPLAEMEALHYIRAIAAGIETGHRHGLVHGNLKPENIIRRAGGNACVVVGYGISAERMLAAVQYAVPGFPHTFTAPEQIGPTGDRLQSADLYSGAALLYYMLTGEPPLAATDRQQPGNRQSPLPLLSMIKPSLQQVIRQGLSLNPQNRPPSLNAWLKLFPGAKQLHTIAKPERLNAPAPPAAPTTPATELSPPTTKIQAQTQLESPASTEIQPAAATPEMPAAATPQSPIPSFNTLPKTVLDPPTSTTDTTAPDQQSTDTGSTPERPAFRREPIAEPPAIDQPTPEPPNPRPRFRRQPIPQNTPEPAMAAAGMSIAPPKSSQADQQLQQRPIRPYPQLPPQASPQRFTLKRVLIAGTLLATIGGVAFGLVLRFSAKQTPVGGGFFEADQSFPNRKWEGSLAPSGFEDAPIENSTNAIPPRRNRTEAPADRPPEPETFDREPIINTPRREPEPTQPIRPRRNRQPNSEDAAPAITDAPIESPESSAAPPIENPPEALAPTNDAPPIPEAVAPPIDDAPPEPAAPAPIAPIDAAPPAE
ncbi:protein kinase [filamentous cyanobacterium LEGE 11480]|uniref:non-specific serine/threonine protein kinase n=1 Tax=Romeriopsis navalis LEGE 11480 TaxID=2777977 RepID=A0A928VRU7_9CYAN|nr:serine/threonine protein kinase [Romeriopsis navalis]MBE9032618.1 protein kinase [Romeriopsis navalis LEGE 11480]